MAKFVKIMNDVYINIDNVSRVSKEESTEYGSDAILFKLNIDTGAKRFQEVFSNRNDRDECFNRIIQK